MDIPEPQLMMPGYQYAPLTAQAFQAEVTRRIRTEIHSAIRKFMRAYCVASLQELPDVSRLYGYFAMVAPGRVACAAPPIPIVAGLCAETDNSEAPVVNAGRILGLVDRSTNLEDRFLSQLMAMNRLRCQGETELALIGCITAIEWFLNDSFPEVVRHFGAGRRHSASISACIRSGALDFLDQDMKDRLLNLSVARNAMVHGPPPSRHPSAIVQRTFPPTIDKAFVLQGLFSALALYKAVNVRLEGSHTSTAQ